MNVLKDGRACALPSFSLYAMVTRKIAALQHTLRTASKREKASLLYSS